MELGETGRGALFGGDACGGARVGTADPAWTVLAEVTAPRAESKSGSKVGMPANRSSSVAAAVAVAAAAAAVLEFLAIPANGSSSAAVVLELLARLVVGAGMFLFDLEADLGAGSLGAAAALVVRKEEPVRPRPWSMAFWMALSKLELLLVVPNDAAVVFFSSASSSAEVLMQVEAAVS